MQYYLHVHVYMHMYCVSSTCTHVHMYIHVCTLYRVHGLRDPVMVVRILPRAAQCFFTVCLGCTPLLCLEIITYTYIVQAEYGMRVWNDLLYMYMYVHKHMHWMVLEITGLSIYEWSVIETR